MIKLHFPSGGRLWNSGASASCGAFTPNVSFSSDHRSIYSFHQQKPGLRSVEQYFTTEMNGYVHNMHTDTQMVRSCADCHDDSTPLGWNRMMSQDWTAPFDRWPDVACGRTGHKSLQPRFAQSGGNARERKSWGCYSSRIRPIDLEWYVQLWATRW